MNPHLRAENLVVLDTVGAERTNAMKTISVRPTDAGDNRYFVLTQDRTGHKVMDSLPFSRLTAEQKAVVVSK